MNKQDLTRVSYSSVFQKRAQGVRWFDGAVKDDKEVEENTYSTHALSLRFVLPPRSETALHKEGGKGLEQGLHTRMHAHMRAEHATEPP